MNHREGVTLFFTTIFIISSILSFPANAESKTAPQKSGVSKRNNPKKTSPATTPTTLSESLTPSLDELQKEPEPTQKPIEKTEEIETQDDVAIEETITRSEFIYPSNWGQAGIFRVRSAESLPEGALTFGIGGEYYSIKDAPDFGFGNRDANTIAESIFIGYSPFKNFSIGVQRRNSSTTFGVPQQLISSLGDFNFSFQYSLPIGQSFFVSPIGNFLIASNFNNLAPTGTTVSAGAGLAGTFSMFASTGLPLFIHGNLLYHLPQLRTTKTGPLDPEAYFTFSRFHTVSLGVGAEYKLGSFIPFIEYYQTVHTNSIVSFGNSPSKVSVGTRILPLENKSLALLLGGDIALGRGITSGVPFSPSYQILGQLSYTFGLHTTQRKHYYTTKDVNVVDRKFVIKKKIYFKVGKAELENRSRDLLNQIATVIKENQVKKLLISGHTDSTATEEFNLRLSLARANSVKDYLVSQGVDSDTLTTQGYGKRKPKASNLTETGRKENRRVEFFILE